MPRDGRPTRDRILDAAERLTIERGFAATSVDRVIAASGTSKGSLFHHFRSKAGLAQALVERYAAADVAHLHRALNALPDGSGPTERLLAFIATFENESEELMAAQSSCLYVAALTEQELVTSATKASIEAAVTTWRAAVTELVGAALAESGRPLPDADVAAIADHVFVTFEGAFLLCRATGSPGHMRAQLGVLRRLVAALTGSWP